MCCPYRHDMEQRRFPVTQLIQFQLIVHGRILDFLNIEGRAGHRRKSGWT